ncbi:flagellar basal body L-ring protein FlgH [Andreprevotia chitinilytica]|uniref:flagellar basal body L-ring protein FlgH n=1 Tax=Andreprevotia chitinilytica TaxID=396808 RepID=UPI00068BCB54|nr:flagellar basal body L-ring protein FlgH [Andreprevotia chitinilytica]
MSLRIAVSIGCFALLQWSAIACAQSLFSEENYLALTSDNRAIRVGDKLTVIVRENTSALSSADTATVKDSSFGASANIAGLPSRYRYIGGKQDVSAGLDIERSAKGKGSTGRTGRINASITVLVSQVEPNGDVVVTGEKNVVVNDESQLIQVNGVVRKGDIQSDNTVESNRLANVSIKIKGEGDLTNAQRQGWLTKLFDWLRIY